jgi:hypothetical protein
VAGAPLRSQRSLLRQDQAYIACLSIEDSPSAGDELATALAIVEFDPAAFSPVTPAFMFVPAILIPLVIGPSPTIRMNCDSEFGTIIAVAGTAEALAGCTPFAKTVLCHDYDPFSDGGFAPISS